MIRKITVNAVCWFSLAILAQCALSPVMPTASAAENSAAHSSKIELWEFTAPWCTHCERMTPIVRNLAEQGIPVRQIPIDEYRSLGEQAGVTRLPCFLLVSNGKIVGRKVGASNERDLTAFYHERLRTLDMASGSQASDAKLGANPTVIRGQQAAPRPFGRLGSAIQSFTDRLAANENPNAPSVPSVPLIPSTKTPSDFSLPTVAPTPTASTIPDTSFAKVQVAPTATAASIATHVSQATTDRSEDPVQRALDATVLLRIEDPQGISLGTGTIVDVHDNEALVLTCGHIFRDSEGKGAISCELQGSHREKGIPGQLISYDLKRDIGLVSVRTKRKIQPIQVAGPGHQSLEREKVFAVGCSQGAPATVIKNHIIAVNRYDGPANLVVGGRPINGRSGGGLFSQNGRLIGVCNAADTEEDEGLYAALGPIQAELDDAALDFVYRRATVPDLQQPVALVTGQAADRSVAETPGRGGTNTVPAQPETNSHAAPEVICIVRPKGSGDDAGKAYVLDKPSAELLSQLSKELGKRGSHQFTGSQQKAR